MTAIARRLGVGRRAVENWLRDQRLSAPTAAPPTRKRFEITVAHLTVIAHEQSLRSAHLKLAQAGLIDCAYSTFARAFRERTDPALVHAALDGWKGLVNNRMYLSFTPPHRNHTWNVDHTVLDLWVWPSHKHRTPIRPHVTGMVDGYSSLAMAVPWSEPINGEMVAASLVDFATPRDYFDVRVGGQPEQVVLDNAAAHFGPAMQEGAERLGWIIAPTAAYSSWQNGRAERFLGLLNERLSNRAPGATKAGTTRTGASRHVARLRKDVNPEDVWSWAAFVAVLQDVVDEINTTIAMDKHGGLTRLQAYASDPTEQRLLDVTEARTAMMSTGSVTHTATKNGLRFQGRDYIGTGLEIGRRYQVRYLQNNRDFIEVFSTDEQYVTQAVWNERLDPDTVAAFMAERARTEREVRAIEVGVIAHRRQLAAAMNASVLYGHEVTEYNGSAARADVMGHAVPGTPGPRVADVTGADPANPAVPTSTPPRSSARRPWLPRVPADARAVSDTDADADITDRLTARFGDGLPLAPVDRKES